MIEKIKELKSKVENENDPIAIICDYLIQTSDEVTEETSEETQDAGENNNQA